MAARSPALAGGDFTLVRDFQPINWSIGRTPRRLVRHMVDDLGNQLGRDRKGMNKVIEADFLPRETNAYFSWSHSIGGSERKERRRILIVDNDPNTTHLVKFSSKGLVTIWCSKKTTLPRLIRTLGIFGQI